MKFSGTLASRWCPSFDAIGRLQNSTSALDIRKTWILDFSFNVSPGLSASKASFGVSKLAISSSSVVGRGRITGDTVRGYAQWTLIASFGKR